MNNDNGCSSKAQAIGWRDGKKKEAVVDCLNSPKMLNQMPEEIRGNTGEMVVWAVKRLSEIIQEDSLENSDSASVSSLRSKETRILGRHAGVHDEHLKKTSDVVAEVFGVKPTYYRIRIDIIPGSPDDFPCDIIGFSYQVSVPVGCFEGSKINDLSEKMEVSLDKLKFYPHDGFIDIHWFLDEVF